MNTTERLKDLERRLSLIENIQVGSSSEDENTIRFKQLAENQRVLDEEKERLKEEEAFGNSVTGVK